MANGKRRMSLFRMPSLGSDMAGATLIEWLVTPGTQVHRGDIIAVVETEKGAIEIEVFEDGFLDQWLVPLGTTVAVGTPIAMIRSGDDPDMPQPVDPSPVPIPPETAQRGLGNLPPVGRRDRPAKRSPFPRDRIPSCCSSIHHQSAIRRSVRSRHRVAAQTGRPC